MFTLKSEMLPLVRGWFDLNDGMRVLDVGCGSGEFTRYLSGAVKNCKFVGVDIDPALLSIAEKKMPVGDNFFKFINTDALALPFEKESFDLVVSHTFFTNIPDPKLALTEMTRVAKKGAKICSVTAQSITEIPLHPGIYPPNHDYYVELATLSKKIFETYNIYKPTKDFLMGLHPLEVPRLFADSCLWNIEMHSTSNDFSLSNAAYSNDFKIKFINLFHEAEMKKFATYLKLDGFEQSITTAYAKRYPELLLKRRDILLAEVGENKIWEWSGGATVVMTGVKPIF